jgi:hypothetical protein
MDEVIEPWIKVELKLIVKPPEMLRNYIKPTILELEKVSLIESFHFFFEGKYGIDLLLRLKLKEEAMRDRAKDIINKMLSEALVRIGDDYRGEVEKFGKDGWKIAQKYFEIASRVSISKVDGSDIRKAFNEGHFVHYLLNPNGYDDAAEMLFHLHSFIGRLLIKNNLQEINEDVKREAIELLDKILKDYEGKKLELI